MISILVPTLGEREIELKILFDSLKNQSNKNFELIVVTQINHSYVEKLRLNYSFNIKHIKVDKRGLSYSRNIGLKYVEGNIVLLSDDDAWYEKDSMQIILDEFKNNGSDVLCFKIKDPIINQDYKNYSKHKVQVNKLQILKKSSIEIAFNLKRINLDDIRFNEEFGLGAKYVSGEENIILNSLLLKNKKIKFINKTIVYHRKKVNSKFDSRYIISKAGLFREIYGKVVGLILYNVLMLKNIFKIEGPKAKGIFTGIKEFVS